MGCCHAYMFLRKPFRAGMTPPVHALGCPVLLMPECPD